MSPIWPGLGHCNDAVLATRAAHSEAENSFLAEGAVPSCAHRAGCERRSPGLNTLSF